MSFRSFHAKGWEYKSTPLFFGYSQRLTRNRPIFILMNLDHYKKKLIKSMRGANTPLSNTQQDKPTSRIPKLE